MATSPELREPLACVLACALAKVPLVSKPAPTTAAPPARRPPFRNERRSTELPIGARSCFSFILILIFLRLQSCSNCVLDAVIGAEIRRGCHLIVKSLQTSGPVATCRHHRLAFRGTMSDAMYN